MHEDPDDAEKRDKHVEAVTSTLPVATRIEGRHLHNDLVTINMYEYNSMSMNAVNTMWVTCEHHMNNMWTALINNMPMAIVNSVNDANKQYVRAKI